MVCLDTQSNVPSSSEIVVSPSYQEIKIIFARMPCFYFTFYKHVPKCLHFLWKSTTIYYFMAYFRCSSSLQFVWIGISLNSLQDVTMSSNSIMLMLQEGNFIKEVGVKCKKIRNRDVEKKIMVFPQANISFN